MLSLGETGRALICVQRRLRVDLLLRAGDAAQDAVTLRCADGQVAASVIAVDNLDRRDGRVAARGTHGRQDLALARVRKRMQARQRPDVVEVGQHVGVEDDLHRLGAQRERIENDTARQSPHPCQRHNRRYKFLHTLILSSLRISLDFTRFFHC